MNPVADVDVVTGARVRLRAPRVDDADTLYAELASDPEVTRFLSWRPHRDVTETRSVITDLFNTGDDPTWLIESADDGALLGLCGWTRTRPNTVELGYCLSRRRWGNGYMAEVAELLCRTAERDPTVYRISAYCHVHNSRSAGVLRRCGLALEGRLVRYAVFPTSVRTPRTAFFSPRP